MEKFIITTDNDTRNKLKSMGLQEIPNSNGMFTFINSAKLNFTETGVDVKTIRFSNILCV